MVSIDCCCDTKVSLVLTNQYCATDPASLTKSCLSCNNRLWLISWWFLLHCSVLKYRSELINECQWLTGVSLTSSIQTLLYLCVHLQCDWHWLTLYLSAHYILMCWDCTLSLLFYNHSNCWWNRPLKCWGTGTPGSSADMHLQCSAQYHWLAHIHWHTGACRLIRCDRA